MSRHGLVQGWSNKRGRGHDGGDGDGDSSGGGGRERGAGRNNEGEARGNGFGRKGARVAQVGGKRPRATGPGKATLR